MLRTLFGKGARLDWLVDLCWVGDKAEMARQQGDLWFGGDHEHVDLHLGRIGQGCFRAVDHLGGNGAKH